MKNIQKNVMKRLFFFGALVSCFLVSVFYLLPTSAENIFELSSATQLQIEGNGEKIPLRLETNPILRDTFRQPFSIVFPSDITDVFLYDATKEISPASWRFDTSKLWSFEAKDDVMDGICDFVTGDGDGDPRLGADDRCGESAFPEKAIFIKTADFVYIFDAKNQSLWKKSSELNFFLFLPEIQNSIGFKTIPLNSHTISESEISATFGIRLFQFLTPPFVSELLPFPENSLFTLYFPAGILLSGTDADETIAGTQIKTDSSGKLTFSLISEKILADDTQEITLKSVQYPSVQKKITVNRWIFASASSIKNILDYGVVSESKKVLDPTPTFSFVLAGKNDELSKAVKYRFQVSDKNDFSTTVYEKFADEFLTLAENGNVETSFEIPTTSKLIPANYFARVQSEDEKGRLSAWSTVFPFTVEQDFFPSAPSGLFMKEMETETEILSGSTITKNAARLFFRITDPNAGQKMGYVLQIANDQNFLDMVQEVQEPTTNAQGEFSFSLAGMVPDQKYYWRVKGIDSAGNVGVWSNALLLKVKIPEPTSFFVKGKDFADYPTLPEKKFFSPATLSDRYLSFGFTLPTLDPLPVYVPFPMTGKGKIFAASAFACENGNCVRNAPELKNISGFSAFVGEKKLTGTVRIDGGGYIYLSLSAMPDSIRALFPVDFAGVQNDGRGAFLGKAWSSKYGMIDFGEERAKTNCVKQNTFDKNNFGVCVDDFGMIQGFAKVKHPLFSETELKKKFSTSQWQTAQTFFVNGLEGDERIFHPAFTQTVLDAVADAEIKTKLTELFQEEGGYIQFSHTDFVGKDAMQTKWRRDGVQTPIEVKSGKSQYAESTILINTIPVKSTKKNFVVAQLDGNSWEMKMAQEFDTSTNAGAEELKNFLLAIPQNGIVVMGSYENPTQGRGVFVDELLKFGASAQKINALTANSAYVLVGRKGKSEALMEQVADGTLRYVQEAEKMSNTSGGNSFSMLLGTGSSQSLGQIIFSPTGGGAELSPPPADTQQSRTGGVVGRLWTEGAGWIFLDSDGNFGSTNQGNDYGMVIVREDNEKNLYFSGRGWGSATGYLEISRGTGMTECKTVEEPNPDHFGICRDKNGAFHGFAWSPSFGWVSFENIYSHDPYSSLGFLFEISKDPSFSSGVTRYQIDKISAGDIVLSAREIFESLGKKCIVTDGIYNTECSFAYGSYYWRVQTLSQGKSSFYGPVQNVTIAATAPSLTHTCPANGTLSMTPEFLFTIAEKNLPTLGVQYAIHFTDTSSSPLIIPSIYSGSFSKEYLKENKEIASLERANGRSISYTIEVTNEEKQITKITCGGDIPYVVRGLSVVATSPKDDSQTSRSPTFGFEVETLENDEYDFFIEVREKGTDGTAFDTWTKISEKEGKKLDADVKNIHTEKLTSNLPANKNLCWQVKIVSKDGTEAKSEVECFSPKNEKPEIENVVMKGDGSVVGTADETRPGSTADRTPAFEVSVKDDSASGKLVLKVFDISTGSDVLWNTFEQNISLTEGKAKGVIQIPDDKELPLDTKNYRFELTFEDDESEKSDTKNGWFVFSQLSNEIGVGNIGTNAVLMTDLQNPPHFQKTEHRFGGSAATGWIDFNPIGGGVYVAPSKVYGYAWNENMGWIRFNCSANAQTKSTFEYKTPMPGVVQMHTLVDTDDEYCKNNGVLENKYGVYPGIVGKNIGDIDVDNQDLLGKVKIEALQEDGKQGFLYFDVETFTKDFPTETTVISEWKNGTFGGGISYKNIHGRPAVGIDKNGKLSGFAWSPSYGWIDMGISQGNTDFNTPEIKKYFPITEYQPAAATCIPKLTIPLANTFEAADFFNIDLAESCPGMKIKGSTLYLRAENSSENVSFSGACQNTENCSLLLDGSVPTGSGNIDYTNFAEKIFEIWGEIEQDNGQKLSIPESQPIRYKIIAASEVDFSANGWSRVFISDNTALANFKDTTQIDVVLKDKFGNEIFETNDIEGKKARDMEFSLGIKNSIRTEQFLAGEWTRGTAVDFREQSPFEERTPNFIEKLFVADSIPLSTSANTSVSMKSLSPTGPEDVLEWTSFSLKIVSLLNGQTAEKVNQNFVQNAETKKMTIGEKEENTVFQFNKIFLGESKFDKPFDETSADQVPYTIALSQIIDSQGAIGDGDNGIRNFHFLHCMESIPENFLSFSPIRYYQSGVQTGDDGKNCFEISKGTGQSQFQNQGDPRFGKVDGNESVIEAPNRIVDIPNENGTQYSLSAQAQRIHIDNPERITAKLYISFERDIDPSNGTDFVWVKYPIENLDTSGAQFLLDEGFVEGSTSGEKIYAETVSNRDEGNFFHTTGSYAIEEVRNALYKSLIQFRNEKGSGIDLFQNETVDSLTITSDDLSRWMKNDDASDMHQYGNVLYNGDVLWVEFKNAEAGNTLVLGDGKNIDDFGGNEAGKKTSKTIVVLGGNVKIDENIFRRYDGTLGIIVLRKNEDLRSSSQSKLANSGNILISPVVTNIRALLYADGSIFSYDPEIDDFDVNNVIYDGFTPRETRNEDLSSQLYFLGSIVAQNTYGGSFAPDTFFENQYINALQSRPVWHSRSDLDYNNSDNRKYESVRFDLKRLRDFRRITKFYDDADENGVKDDFEDEDGNCDKPVKSECTPIETYFVAAEGHFPAYENFTDISLLKDPMLGWNDDNSSGKKARSAVVFEYDEQIQKNPPPGTVVFSEFKVNQ